jgi:hypothetical protein
MKSCKELVKEFQLIEIDDKIDIWLDYNKEREYLTFDNFKNVFYTNYQIKKTNQIDAILSTLYVCFCLKMSKRGVGIQDLQNKYNNIYFDFLQSLELKGYCNSPVGIQQIDFKILSQNFDSESYSSFDNYLFYNYATKNMKFKYFNSLGREPIMYQSYGNKLDLVSYTIDKLAENFEGHKFNKLKTNVYKLNFSTNLDDTGLVSRFGLERTETIKSMCLVINTENYNNYQNNADLFTKEKFLINEAKNELR